MTVKQSSRKSSGNKQTTSRKANQNIRNLYKRAKAGQIYYRTDPDAATEWLAESGLSEESQTEIMNASDGETEETNNDEQQEEITQAEEPEISERNKG